MEEQSERFNDGRYINIIFIWHFVPGGIGRVTTHVKQPKNIAKSAKVVKTSSTVVSLEER